MINKLSEENVKYLIDFKESTIPAVAPSKFFHLIKKKQMNMRIKVHGNINAGNEKPEEKPGLLTSEKSGLFGCPIIL